MTEQKILEYMRATIRARNPRDMERWSVPELVGAFNTIPDADKVEFELWAARMSGEPAAAAAAAATPSEEEIVAQNSRFLAAMGKEFPGFKERLDDEAAAAKVAAA